MHSGADKRHRHRGACGERGAEGTVDQGDEGCLEAVGRLPVSLVVVTGQGHPAQLLGSLFEDGDQLHQGRLSRSMVVVEHTEGGWR